MRPKKIYVPGRLCIFGEHSDWASDYINKNSKIKDGHAIVACINKGIYANIKKISNEFILKDKDNVFKTDLDINNINNEIKKNPYYLFVATVLKYMLVNYDVEGIELDIYKNDLPEKKGLSSSASICVLVCRAFNELYDLHLSIDDEMEIAYYCERYANSKCGKMDQIVALNSGAYCMHFHAGNVKYDNIKIGKDIYMVFADLKSSKNTPKILADLHKAYPFPKNDKEENLIKYLGEDNEKIVTNAIKLFEDGKAKELGELMSKAQDMFDKYVSPLSPKELASPKLHEVLNDETIKKLSYGGKGVGSQGDGSVQFIVENESKQKKLIKYLNKKLDLDAYPLKIEKSIKKNKVRKAIIPLAGMGTRMYPFTNSIPKSFIPIVKDNQFKPIVQILIEELVDAGIETIGLVINRNQKELYDTFFTKLEDNKELINHIEYYYQDEQLGLGDAVLCAKDLINNEPFLLVLGDQFYTSFEENSCTKQLLDIYDRLQKNVISVYKTDLKNVEKYGVFFGKTINKGTYKITNIIEKPTIELAKSNNLFKNKNDYYIAFGEYIFDNKILKYLEKYKKKNPDTIIPFTEFINIVYDDIYSYITNGKMYDIGNINSYIDTIKDIYK